MNTSEKSTAQKREAIYRLAVIGMMSALVYAGNFMSIPLANETRIHLGNSMCLLAALLFGSINGGLASGIGGALYDLFNPLYTLSAPYTFFSKFAMGWTAGKLNRCRIRNETSRAVLSAVVGQTVYIILYLAKSFVKQLYLGNPIETAVGVMAEKAVTSLTNGVIAVVVAVPLYFALKKALYASPFRSLLDGNTAAAAK